jgi:hypothetical protein
MTTCREPGPRDSTEALRSFFSDGSQRTFEGAIADGPCLCERLVPRGMGELAQRVRCALVMAANLLPFSSLRVPLYRLAGVRIGRGAFVSPHVVIDPLYPQLIRIGEDALLGMGCRLMTHEYTATRYRLGRVRVGKGSVVGAFSTVRSGVHIGDRATVGMHSFVNGDVPDGATVAGVPARPLPGGEPRTA